MPGLWLTSINGFFAWPLQTSTMKYSNTVPYNYFRPNLVILLNGQRQNRSRLTFSKLEQNFQLHSNSTKLKICMSNSNPNLSPTRLKFSSNALFRRNCRSIVSIVQDQINEQEVLLGATGLTKKPIHTTLRHCVGGLTILFLIWYCECSEGRDIRVRALSCHSFQASLVAISLSGPPNRWST